MLEFEILVSKLPIPSQTLMAYRMDRCPIRFQENFNFSRAWVDVRVHSCRTRPAALQRMLLQSVVVNGPW